MNEWWYFHLLLQHPRKWIIKHWILIMITIKSNKIQLCHLALDSAKRICQEGIKGDQQLHIAHWKRLCQGDKKEIRCTAYSESASLTCLIIVCHVCYKEEERDHKWLSSYSEGWIHGWNKWIHWQMNGWTRGWRDNQGIMEPSGSRTWRHWLWMAHPHGSWSSRGLLVRNWHPMQFTQLGSPPHHQSIWPLPFPLLLSTT